jgi:hypothetical protein
MQVAAAFPKLLVAGLALGLVGAPAATENPRVSIKVENASAADAAAALSRASGIRLELSGAGGAERLTFDWTGVSFGRALRQLCEKVNVQPVWRLNGYVLESLSGAPPPPVTKRVGLVEKNGARIYVRGAFVQDKRYRNFLGEAPDGDDSQLVVQMVSELTDGDAQTVAGVENVTAKDDLGNLLVTDENRGVHGQAGSRYPDQWWGNAFLTLPHPKARKLQWLEGDLMVYRNVKPLRVEIALPVTEKSIRRQAGDWFIVVSKYQAEHRDPEDDDEGLPQLGGGGGQKQGPSMRVRVYYPQRQRVTWRGGWGWHPYLVDTAGRAYAPVQSGGSAAGDGQITMSDSFLVFPETAAPPAKVVWDLVDRTDPVRLFSFRMTDIPLPDPPAFVRRSAAPRPATAASVETDHPFYERAGGVLINRVQMGPEPAREGRLQVGLAERTEGGSGPLRWIDVEVGADGAARLEALRAGTYRLLRLYRPRSLPEGWDPAAGRWLNAEVTITVVPGKDVEPPALHWSREPLPVPGQDARPSAQRRKGQKGPQKERKR